MGTGWPGPQDRGGQGGAVLGRDTPSFSALRSPQAWAQRCPWLKGFWDGEHPRQGRGSLVRGPPGPPPDVLQNPGRTRSAGAPRSPEHRSRCWKGPGVSPPHVPRAPSHPPPQAPSPSRGSNQPQTAGPSPNDLGEPPAQPAGQACEEGAERGRSPADGRVGADALHCPGQTLCLSHSDSAGVWGPLSTTGVRAAGEG